MAHNQDQAYEGSSGGARGRKRGPPLSCHLPGAPLPVSGHGAPEAATGMPHSARPWRETSCKVPNWVAVPSRRLHAPGATPVECKRQAISARHAAALKPSLHQGSLAKHLGARPLPTQPSLLPLCMHGSPASGSPSLAACALSLVHPRRHPLSSPAPTPRKPLACLIAQGTAS